ncbi:MAG TPA: ferrous iron transport protein B [Sedimentisphaerales bacterium]|jgi:ferrous iron transport protein B|nr:ferrous iron transport protein B [Sedimentisphaerales bacterium]HNU31065.1 ferrous iron transport protein B [Sedimentisphaerales bacterium]
MTQPIVVAMVGNPNSGKSSLFNMITGSHQHVGNYPGVTVEKKEGYCTHDGCDIRLIDLPGTYSLTAYSAEELITRRFILEERPDVVVDVVDASNIERNLYLGTQLIEMNVPLVFAFNMSDLAKRRGLEFDLDQLSCLLEARIVPTVGSKGEGGDALLEGIVRTAREGRKPRIHGLRYGAEIEEELARVEAAVLERERGLADRYGSRWVALKLLEQDDETLAKIQSPEVRDAASKSVGRLRSIFRDEPEIVLADRRYGFISGACQETIRSSVERRHDASDLVDAIVTNKVFGLPIFLVLMYAVFWLTFTLGEFPMIGLEWLFGWLGAAVSGLWPEGSDSWLRSLLVDGVIAGVGGVIVFLPNILLLFLAIAMLEDTGYMARAAFVMDRIMHKIGLHGKSFIPMLIGFGCSVPAIMAARILENRRNQLTTIMVIPLMSCGARLTIYSLIIPAFFAPAWRGPVMWLVYLIGILLAVTCAKLLRLTVFQGETLPFVMELPPYRMPTPKSVLIHMWQRGWMFLRKAGTVILGISVVLWVLASFPKPSPERLAGLDGAQARQAALEQSVMGRVGRFVEPAIRPLGFDWRIGTALIGAVAAKEVFVSQLSIVYATGSDEDTDALRKKLRANYTPLAGFCIMLFSLISTPCAATVAMTRQETGSWRWAAFQFVGLTVLAYVITLAVFQVGRMWM